MGKNTVRPNGVLSFSSSEISLLCQLFGVVCPLPLSAFALRSVSSESISPLIRETDCRA